MTISRRNFLKKAGLGLAAAFAAPALPVSASSGGTVKAENSASMLYDGIKCVGCRACQTACKARSNLRFEKDSSGLYEQPNDLSAYTWTLIKLYQGPTANSFVKAQCMHCIEPACVAACPVGALQKTSSGPVIYHKERCIGCRYCMTACPFGIPKSQWDKALPFIQKCDFCADRQARGEQPACGEACPTGALIYGTRKEMLGTARTRLAQNVRYTQHVYGETEAGGTSMLYIAQASFTDLGFPELSDQAIPEITQPYMNSVPIVAAGMIALSTAIYFRTHHRDGAAPAEKKEG